MSPESIAIIGVVCNAVAIVATVIVAFRQMSLTSEIALKQMALTSQISEHSTKLSQRQLFVEIWHVISRLNAVDPANPIADHVIIAVNALDLVALCWEGQLVDADIIRRSFGERYLEMYKNIDKVPKLPNINKSGHDLIRENRAIEKLYNQLNTEHAELGAIKPLQS